MRKHYFLALMMAAGANLALAQIPTNGLVAKYSFNAGNAMDEAGTNHGTVIGGVTPTEDRFGNAGHAYQLNGVNGMIDFGNAPEFQMGNGNFAISFWVYYDIPQLAMVIGKRGPGDNFAQYSVFIGNGNINFLQSGSSMTTLVRAGGVNRLGQASDQSGGWKHVVLNHNHSSNTALYVDGQLVSNTSLTLNGLLNVPDRPFQVGFYEQGENTYFNGKVDDIFVYNRMLTEAEITELYNDPAPTECIVSIPDANFKAALVGNNSINTNQDGEIQCDEAAAFSGFLNLNGVQIADLTGLEAFTAITALNLSNTSVSSFDISANTALTILYCNNNNLSGNLSFSAANANLQELWLSENNIASLNVSALTQLQTLICEDNSLTSIDVSNNLNLRELQCRNNGITAFDLLNNTGLRVLGCRNNQITALDLSDKPELYFLDCNGNNLNYLNVANGNNTNFTYINSQNNLNLSCIQVDDVTYSTANWTGSNFIIGSQTSFSEDCLTVGLEESESIILTAYPNPTSGILFLSQPSSGQVLDLSGHSLMSFSNARTIDLSNLASGAYLVRTVDGGVMRVVRE